MEFPGKATPVAPADMASALVRAYAQRFGQTPSRQTAELLLALLFLEHDHGRAVIEHNWGNLSVTAGDGVDYWRPPWFDLEKINAMPDDAGPSSGFGAETAANKKQRYLRLHADMLAGKAPSAFRAFNDDDAGLASFLATVKSSMYAAAASGDPMAFAQAYWSSGYCPDQACKDSGPSFRKLQAEIRNAGYFTALPAQRPSAPPKKKAGPESLGLWFWAWGLLLRRATRQRGPDHVGAQLSGEP